MIFFRKIFRKIFPERTPIDFPGGYIPHRFFLERITEGPVLVIGDFSGRDYPAIREKIGEAYLVDVADTKVAFGKYFIKQSIEKRLPFPDKFFKAVFLTEVLEHIWEDRRALELLREILVDDGILLLSVPFWSDFHDRHYHIYSPRTIRMVIHHAGYKIIETNYRGMIVNLPYWLVAFLALFLYPFYGRASLQKVNDVFYRVHMILGRFRRINFGFPDTPFFLWCCGVNIVAKKSDAVKSAIAEQREYYEDNERASLVRR